MLLGSFAVRAPAQSQPSPVTDQAVRSAIARGVEWLKGQRNGQGHWERQADESSDRYWGGDTALALLALLYAGEDAREEYMSRALDWLALQPARATYVVGVRAHVWALVPGAKYRKALDADVQWLQQAAWRRGVSQAGAYGYDAASKDTGDGGYYDNSNSQFGVLGAWMASEAGSRLPPEFWELVEQHWIRDQRPDGGWAYQAGSHTSTGSMTAAGLATLFVLLDQAHARSEGRFNGTTTTNCGKYKEAARVISGIETGLNWLGREFDAVNPRGDAQWQYYYLYGVERVGRASGFKYFRDKDWFRIGATRLLEAQDAAGGWPGTGLCSALHNTSFALMFLCHGGAPLMFNKLDWGVDSLNKLRDAAGLTRYAQRAFERLLNWQITRLDRPLEDLLEAPVLYFSGHFAWEFSDAEIDRLREYCQRGGLLFGVACCGREGFTAGFRALAKRAFPDFPVRPVPKEHPLFNGEVQYTIDDPPLTLEVNNGHRTLMLLSTADVCTAWNQYLVREYEAHFHYGCNVYLYATDKATYASRLQTADIPLRDGPIRRTVRLARIRHSGAWDVEPYGWVRMTHHMNNETASRLLLTGDLGLDSPELAEFRMAYLTGDGALALSAAEQLGLRNFLTGGGTLLADAAGGSEAFTASLESYVRDVLKCSPMTVEADSFLITGAGIPQAQSLKSVSYRRAARSIAGGTAHPRLRAFESNRRLAVIYSPLDLSIGLLGTPVYGCRGYDPESCLDIVRNMLLYAQLSSDEKAKLTRQP
ncbi:MAG: DUF4159 domain-containing protein [Phycisphaerae bacterium]